MKAGSLTLEEFGLNKADYQIKDWENSIHPEDRERVVRNFEKITTSEVEKFEEEYRFIKPDGSIAYERQGSVVRDASGKVIKSLGGWIDLTKREEHELTLMQAIERQEKLNEEISTREEELASSEEELLRINEQYR